jgi:microcystin-dependent protein
MCSANSSLESASALATSASDLISVDALREYNECKRIESENLHVKTEYFDDASLNGTNVIGITLSYTPSLGTSQRPKIQSIDVTPQGSFDCVGPLVALRKPAAFTEAAMSMTCTRAVTATAVPALNDPGAPKRHSPASVITVNTAAGAVRRSTPAILAAIPPAPTRDPIAAVTAFAGAADDDARLPSGWLPCDHRPLRKVDYPELFNVIGVTYGTGIDAQGNRVADFNLPDYRGFFLRGLDRGSASQPISTDVRDEERRNVGASVGTVEIDKFKEHEHPVAAIAGTGIGQNTGSNNAGGFADGAAYSPHTGYIGYRATASGVGGTETRPKNVAVVYLIRVK